jgi:hypothetical protein
MSNPPINLTESQKDYAIFLPAISGFYGTYIAKQRLEDFVPASRMPAGFDRGVEGLNFLNPEQGYFSYKYGLYSAGHAQLDLKKSYTQESMVQQRDRNNTLILGDSGGFQIGKGVLKFDFRDFEGAAANKMRDDILYWLEETADWSMMLDVPTWACDETHGPKTGLKTFEDCLEKTRFNNEYFLKNRLGKTKLLNVLQGDDWELTEKWYNGVKEYSDPAVWGDRAADGWAFGSGTKSDMDITLKRLMTLREDGLLKGKNWIHFLGTAQMDWACYLTAIQRQIRKHINEDVTISFDCASPFVATAYGLVYTNSQHTAKRWSVIMEKAPDNKALAGSDIPFPFESEIGRRLTMGDICYYDLGVRKTDKQLGKDDRSNQVKFDHLNKEHYTVVPRLNKLDKIPNRTSWDSFAYALMMGHNVYSHIAAVQRANHLMDMECARELPDWRHWRKLNAKESNMDEYSVWVPRNILYFNRFVAELFETKSKQEAFDMIEQADSFLCDLAGSWSTGPVPTTFNNLFDFEHTLQDEIDFANRDDDKLRGLEDSLDE